MRKLNSAFKALSLPSAPIFVLILTLILVPMTHVKAGETGSSRSRTSPSQAVRSPGITDPNNDSRISVSGTLNAHNTGVESIALAASVAKDASRPEKVARAIENTKLTTKYASCQADVTDCKLLHKDVRISCYGNEAKGAVLISDHYDPRLMTAAYPDSKQQGNIMVFRVPSTNNAHAFTIVDFGPNPRFQKPTEKFPRWADASTSGVTHFGARCPTFLDHAEIYQCKETKWLLNTCKAGVAGKARVAGEPTAPTNTVSKPGRG